jgi:hypothetical protein
VSIRIKRARGGRVDVTLGEGEVALLRHLLEELLTLLDEGAGAGQADQDPLAAAVGIGTSTRAPDDPVLARLLPDAYREDPDAASEFRRYTEDGLRARKRAAAGTVLATLGAPGERVRLQPDEAQAWLLALNDLRLALGTRLGVTEDIEEMVESMGDDDDRMYGLLVYDHLTGMQELLVRSLSRA